MKTGNCPSPPRCPLGNLIPTTLDAEALKHDGWNNQGILVVSVADQRINWMERQVIEQIGKRFYGGR